MIIIFNIIIIKYAFCYEPAPKVNKVLNYVDNKYYVISKPYTDKKYLVDAKGEILLFAENSINTKTNIYISANDQNKYYFVKEEYNVDLAEMTVILYDEQLNIVDTKENVYDYYNIIDNTIEPMYVELDDDYSFDAAYYKSMEENKINYDEKSNFILKHNEIFENTNINKIKYDKAYDMDDVYTLNYENYTQYLYNKNEILAIDYNNVEENELYFFENKYIVVVSEKSIYFFEKNDKKSKIEPYVIYGKRKSMHQKDIHYIVYANLTHRINIGYATVDVKFTQVPNIEYNFNDNKYLFIIKDATNKSDEGVYDIKGRKIKDFYILKSSFIIQHMDNVDILYDRNFNVIIKQQNIVDISYVDQGVKGYIIHSKKDNKIHYKLVTVDGKILVNEIKTKNDNFEFLYAYKDYTDLIKDDTNKTYYQFLENKYIIYEKNNCSIINYDNEKNKKELNNYQFLWEYYDAKHFIYLNNNKYGLLDENLNNILEVNE